MFNFLNLPCCIRDKFGAGYSLSVRSWSTTWTGYSDDWVLSEEAGHVSALHTQILVQQRSEDK